MGRLQRDHPTGLGIPPLAPSPSAPPSRRTTWQNRGLNALPSAKAAVADPDMTAVPPAVMYTGHGAIYKTTNLPVPFMTICVSSHEEETRSCGAGLRLTYLLAASLGSSQDLPVGQRRRTKSQSPAKPVIRRKSWQSCRAVLSCPTNRSPRMPWSRRLEYGDVTSYPGSPLQPIRLMGYLSSFDPAIQSCMLAEPRAKGPVQWASLQRSMS